MKDKLSSRTRCVELLGQGEQLHTLCLKPGHNVYKVPQRTAEAVQAPNNKGVPFAERTKATGEFWPSGVLSACVLLIDGSATGPGKGLDLQG